MNDQEKFAFGTFSYDAIGCPSKTAGFASYAPPVVTRYDEIVRRRTGKDSGFVDRDVARKCWLEAVEQEMAEGSRAWADRALDIAAGLGWLGDEADG